MHSEPVSHWRAPGRVNIIGEHIDYLGGTVLPFACDLEVVVRAVSSDEIEFTSPDADPSRYVRGVTRALDDAALPIVPCRGEIASTIPVGAGLSSSAAVAAAIALALTGGVKPSPAVMQRAEQLSSGVPCGVMDQTAVLEGRAGHALVLDCATGAFDYIALPEAIGFVVIDTGTRRELADGRYAKRRAEVESGDPKRLAHATSEQRRVYDAVDALRAADIASLGALVTESHASLRNDFEVSSDALDAAVARAVAHPSCYGARLVGAGFAGCVLAVVEPEAAGHVAGMFARAWVVSAVEGAGRAPRSAS